MKAERRWLLSGAVVALLVGCMAGYLRYWFGYVVLGQGVLVGWIIPRLLGRVVPPDVQNRIRSANVPTFKVSLFFCICFMVAQGVGFGWAQPWFDPLPWLGRVIAGDTSEHLFGIALMGGVQNRAFSLGVGGGFWIFLNIFDLVFMEFFLLVGLNTSLERKKS